MSKTPDHLGGHFNKSHVDIAVLEYLIKKYDIKSMVDIGCGPGKMVHEARDRRINAWGVDGDPALFPNIKHMIEHDFTTGPIKVNTNRPSTQEFLEFYDNYSFDLAWSVEFVEHVDEEYIDNFMDLFKRCKYTMLTSAPPGTENGHHHVNCRSLEYWKDMFKQYGFEYSYPDTMFIRKISKMPPDFVRLRGQFFKRI